MHRHLLRPGLTHQLVFIQENTGVFGDDQFLVGIDDVSQVFQTVSQFTDGDVVGGTGSVIVHLLSSTDFLLGAATYITKETATGIAGIQHGHQLFFSLGTIEQATGHTKHQQVGRCFANDFFTAFVVTADLGDFLLGQTLVKQFQERGKSFLIGRQVVGNLVHDEVHGTGIGH